MLFFFFTPNSSQLKYQLLCPFCLFVCLVIIDIYHMMTDIIYLIHTAKAWQKQSQCVYLTILLYCTGTVCNYNGYQPCEEIHLFFIILTQENTNRTSRHITIDNSQVIFSHQDYTHPTLTNFPFFCLPLAFINPNHCLCSHNTQCLIFYFIFHSLSVWSDVENDFRILSYYKIQMDVAVKSPYVQQNIHLNSYFFLSQKTERKFSHSLLSIFFSYILYIWIFERPFEYLFCKS